MLKAVSSAHTNRTPCQVIEFVIPPVEILFLLSDLNVHTQINFDHLTPGFAKCCFFASFDENGLMFHKKAVLSQR